MLIELALRFRRTKLGIKFKPVFFFFGEVYRKVAAFLLPNLMVKKNISRYGPFLLGGKFLFSDFSHWSEGHNVGFDELIEEARGKTCVFDIGAHIGLTTLPLANVVDAAGRVYAFEPSTSNLIFLKKHLKANNFRNVSVVEKLVGNKVDVCATFFEDEGVSGMNSMARIEETRREKQIEIVTIDSFSLGIGVIPDLIKIDIEGAELMALEGAKDILAQYLPTVFLSIHPRQIAALGQSVDDLKKIIVDLGYEVWDVKRDTRCTGQLQFGEYRLEARANRL